MFNFYVILAGYDMVTDAVAGLTRSGAKWEPHHYKQKKTKKARNSRKHGL